VFSGPDNSTQRKLLGGSFYELQYELANDLESTLEDIEL
jgi:hypothetical protein